MKIRLYLDEDAMFHGFKDALRAQGIDVRTVEEEGAQGYSDEQQLLYAKALGWVIYSFNRGHFMALHTRFLTEGISYAGIILAPQNRYSIGEQLRRILLLIEAKSAEEMQNQVVFLSNWG
jgi:Domain of unknown function (DUF5615)